LNARLKNTWRGVVSGKQDMDKIIAIFGYFVPFLISNIDKPGDLRGNILVIFNGVSPMGDSIGHSSGAPHSIGDLLI
jgi:hypothetical protein